MFILKLGIRVCEMYKDALAKLMEGRSDPVGPPANEKLIFIRKYMDKAEVLKRGFSHDNFQECVSAATKTITAAVNYDKSHNYVDAVQYYRRGIDYYQRAIKVATTQHQRTSLIEGMKPYEKRVNKLGPLVEEGLRQAALATYDEEEGGKPACWDDRLSRATNLVKKAVKFDKRRNYVQVCFSFPVILCFTLAMIFSSKKQADSLYSNISVCVLCNVKIIPICL